MARNNNKSSLACPVMTTQNLIGGKWKILLIYQLSSGTKRFNELQKALPAITQATLTQQLRQLENDRLITRTVYPVVPPKVEYALTSHGQKFVPIMEAMCAWATEYLLG